MSRENGSVGNLQLEEGTFDTEVSLLPFPQKAPGSAPPPGAVQDHAYRLHKNLVLIFAIWLLSHPSEGHPGVLLSVH